MLFHLNNEEQRKKVIEVIQYLDVRDDWAISINPFTHKRSNNQNSIYWVWIRILSNHFGYSDMDFHEILKAEFIGVTEITFRGRQQFIPKSSKELSKLEFADYMQKIYALGINQGIQLPLP